MLLLIDEKLYYSVIVFLLYLSLHVSNFSIFDFVLRENGVDFSTIFSTFTTTKIERGIPYDKLRSVDARKVHVVVLRRLWASYLHRAILLISLKYGDFKFVNSNKQGAEVSKKLQLWLQWLKNDFNEYFFAHLTVSILKFERCEKDNFRHFLNGSAVGKMQPENTLSDNLDGMRTAGINPTS